MVTLFLFVISAKYISMLAAGETFIPTWVYQHLGPWQSEQKPPWNVLSADGLFEFLPWRTIVMESVSNGHLPIVNPYAASTLGGQPLLANGQSAFFYPIHWAFWILPASFAPVTLMVSIVIHMVILALGTYLLARRLSAGPIGAMIAAIGFSQSATMTTWLPLSSHLTVVAWLPWMWLATLNKSFKALSIVTAMSLLAGHLQLSMYSLLTSAIISLIVNWRNRQSIRLISALMVGILLATCQMFPSIELGQQSHRGGVAASAEGYTAYIGNAMPIYHFVSWIIPNFFGTPNANSGSSWILTANGIPNNYAEWALYAGTLIPVLLIAGIFQFKSLTREVKTILLISILAMLVAVGTPICAVMYYGIPGFAATGNPARVLPVFTLAISLIASVAITKTRLRHILFGIGILASIACVCYAVANQTAIKLALPIDITNALAADALLTQLPILLLTMVVLLMAVRFRTRFPLIMWLLPATLLTDLLFWSSTYHPVGKVTDAIRTTPGIEYLKQNAAKSPIACIVGNWSMGSASPKGATLPPNILTLHGLYDVATYDSLIVRRDKTHLESLAGVSLMPPENGNLLRIPSVEVASRLGAQWIVLPENIDVPDGWNTVYTGSDMTILHRNPEQPVEVSPTKSATTALRVGIFLSCFVAATVLVSTKSSRKNLRLLYR